MKRTEETETAPANKEDRNAWKTPLVRKQIQSKKRIDLEILLFFLYYWAHG